MITIKDKKLSIRISEENLKAIHKKAAEANLSFTDYVTESCLGNQIVIIDGMDEVIRQQKALGRNINQLTTLCNMGKVRLANLNNLTLEYAEINRTLSKLLRKRR